MHLLVVGCFFSSGPWWPLAGGALSAPLVHCGLPGGCFTWLDSLTCLMLEQQGDSTPKDYIFLIAWSKQNKSQEYPNTGSVVVLLLPHSTVQNKSQGQAWFSLRRHSPPHDGRNCKVKWQNRQKMVQERGENCEHLRKFLWKSH